MQFDYIIIGAGSAGCVLANRLSEDPGVSVLLVEAGGKDSNPQIHIPGGYMKLHHSKVDWNCYWTVPQPDLLNRKIYHPRGKVLGGCSSTNAMAYIRGHREDYNGWAKAGNSGWSYEEVLPYFKKSERNEQFENEYHSSHGPLNVTHALRYRTPLAMAFIEACAQAGIIYNEDFNGINQEGAGWFQYTMKDSERHSTARAFLHPVMHRKNLKMVLKALVKRILIERDEVTGIEVLTGSNQTEKIYASREIILSAGAFSSPHLLMLSGIGPSDILKKAGISTKKDLPGVGKNLQDHLFYAVSSLCGKPISNNHFIPLHRQAIEIARYYLFKKGPLTIGPLEANAFLKSSPDLDRPDIQFQFTPTHAGEDYSTNPFDLRTFPHTDGYTILPTQVRPESRGHITLVSNNPLQPPQIDPQYLSSEKDRLVMVHACRKAIEVLNQNSFDSFRMRNHCPRERDSDDALLLHIQRSAECVYHPVGTCKMGNDETAVVNSSLQVYGVGKLRVADASVIPNITGGNTNAPVIMIAEKASDMIIRKR